MRATVAAVQRELQRGCFVWRFHSRSLGQPDLPLDGLEGAFLPCTFWLASTLARMKRTGEARELLERVNQAFHGRGLYSEEFDPVTGRALGNFLLLFSHAEHLKAVMDLRWPLRWEWRRWPPARRQENLCVQFAPNRHQERTCPT